MRRRPSQPAPRHRWGRLVLRAGWVAAALGLAGCHVPTRDYQTPMPPGMAPVPVDVSPPRVIARGVAPSVTVETTEFPPDAIHPAARPPVLIPPPASVAPVITVERSRDDEPKWATAAGDNKPSLPGVPGLALPEAPKLPAPRLVVDVAPAAPVAPVAPLKPAAFPDRVPTAANPRQWVPPARKAPAFPDRVPLKDDGVIVVGGVPVPVPPVGGPPAAVKPVAAQPAPVLSEPPIRPLNPPRALPPLLELPAVPSTPAVAPPPPAAGPVPVLPLPPGVAPVPAPPAVLPAPPAVVPAPSPAVLPAAPPALVPGLPGVQLPGVPAPMPAIPVAPLPGPTPAPLPVPVPAGPGPIDVNGVPLPFDSLAALVGDGDSGGGGCSSCGGSCSGGQCRAGKKPCEPFPARTHVGRIIGLIYEGVCCPDPCYRPHFEPITAAAFFVDAPRPVTQTRLRWDYGSRFTFPDRGEYFWARADGKGKGPKPNAPALGTPALDYHELYLDQEIAASPTGSVLASMPYRSVNPTPFANSSAGFGDLQITAKSLLFDSELFMLAFQMRTYIPTGQAKNGLGTGHLSLEPGVIAGIRVTPNTYAIAQVQEWIPIAGDKDYMGAALRYHFALNHVLWRPVKDVQLIGSWEGQGFGFQDGRYTEPAVGGFKLSGQTSFATGAGLRLCFCDTFDFGGAWMHGITGQYPIQDQMRVEVRYRY